MPKPFTLTAIPELLPECEYKGQLEYVTFIATARNTNHERYSTNTGTYEADFAKVVSEIEDRAIVERLRRCDTVTFPALFDYDELRRHKFGGASND